MEADTGSDGTMAMQMDDPDNAPLQQQMIDSSDALDEVEQHSRTMRPANAQRQILLELTSCLVSMQSISPETALSVEFFERIVSLNPTTEFQEPKDYEVLRALKQRFDSVSRVQVEQLAPVFQDLANLCRDEAWRTPLGEVGLLQTATDILAAEASMVDTMDELNRIALQRQVLRFVGNMCADIDENRERVLQNLGLQAVLVKFENKDLADIAVPAMFNICNDYDAAKQAAMQSNLFSYCLSLLQESSLKATPTFSYLCLMLDIVCDKVDVENIPSNALDILLKASLDGDLEIAERLSLVHLINRLLTSETNQKSLVNDDKVELVLGSLFRTYSEGKDPMDVILSGLGSTTSEDIDEEQDLLTSRSTLVALMSDISTLPEFVKKYEIFTDTSMIVWKLRYIMLSPLPPISQVACLMLGNLACSDDICIRMVKDVAIHEAASLILREAADVQLLHAALGLLRNLALPAGNKESLAMVSVIENAQRCLFENVNPEIQLVAASLMRQMINGSMANILRLLLMSSSVEDGTGSMQTQLAILLKVYDRTDEIAIKTEIARTVIAVLRCIHGKSIDPDVRNTTLANLYSHHTHLVRPVIDMVLQSQYPVVRSEAWFALGLMSRDAAGREMIAKEGTRSDLYGLLQSTIQDHTVADEHKQSASTTDLPAVLSGTSNQVDSKIQDRDNALVLVHELCKIQDSSVLDTSFREQLIQLLDKKIEDSPHG